MKAKIEDALAQWGEGVFHTRGISMEPILHDMESAVVISADLSHLRKNDVVLFQRPTGVYVLHRILRIQGDTLRIRGDNQVGRPERVPRAWLLGVMTGFTPSPGAAFIPATDPAYQKYVSRLKWTYPLRWLKALPGRVRRKLLHK